MPFLFEGPTVKIQAPPAPPAAPGLTAEERELLDLERQLGLVNLEIQREQQAQDQAVRTALERQFGGPLAEVLANQVFQQSRLQSGVQGEQAAAVEQARLEREAIARLSGVAPAELAARQFLDQLELGSLTRTVQRKALEQADAERAAFIAATGMTPEAAQAQEAAFQQRIRGPLQARFEKGLAGTLPVSPALERSLDEQRMELEGSLLQRFGPGALIPSPGNPAMAALAEFDKRAIELRTAAREGAIGEAEQFGFSLQPATERIRQSRAAALSSAGTGGLAGALPDRLTGREFLGAPITSPIPTLIPFTQRSLLQTPPQFANVRGALAGQRAFEFAPQMAGYEGNLNYLNTINQARIGAAGAQAQGLGQLLSSLVGAGGTLGAAALMRNSPRWGFARPGTQYPF